MIQSISNGRPTKPQVEKLFLRVKDMKDGDLISHEQIAGLIGEAKNSFRYRTIINAANRRILNELECILVSERGIGYRRATGCDQVRSAVSNINGSIRRIGRNVRVAAVVSDDRLPDGQHRVMRDRIVERANFLHQLAKVQRKEISLTLGKPELLPK